MFDTHQEIADLEAEIDELADAAERCRKVIVLARVATGAGGLLFVITLIGLVRSGPVALVLAITAVPGGLALFGSHTSTRDQIMAKLRAREARQALLIGELDLRDVGANEGTADPEEVHAFYNMRRRNLLQAEPNPAHFALARLEAALAERGGNLFLCTQNIDDLHERAGSHRVVHMHGELLKARCIWCEAGTEWRGDLGSENACPSCGRAGGMRPHVVWFGEMPLSMDVIEEGLMGADLFVAIGTSGSVYPAAGFMAEAKAAGIRTCEINLEPSDNAHRFDERRYGSAGEVVPAWAEEILASTSISRFASLTATSPKRQA